MTGVGYVGYRGTKAQVSAHLNVANHMTPQNGCQFVTVVLMVEPILPIRRQGLQGRICGPQHSEGAVERIVKHGQEASHLWVEQQCDSQR